MPRSQTKLSRSFYSYLCCAFAGEMFGAAIVGTCTRVVGWSTPGFFAVLGIAAVAFVVTAVLAFAANSSDEPENGDPDAL